MLSIIEDGLEVLSRRGPADTEVRAATADSRCVRDGTVFAAIPGARLDGHDYIPQALAAGASAVLLRDWPAGSEWPEDRVGLQVADPRRALALAAHRLQGEPSQGLKVIGITGTNGKTSTVAILRSVLEAAGIPSGGIGTTGIEWMGAGGPVQHAATHTTPEGPVLFDWLARMRDDGVEAVALELSSHALEQGRAAGLALDVALWTNLSRDHLDYHGDMERYEAAKALLFGEWLASWGKPGATAVVNVDDPVVARHLEDHPRSLTVSSRPGVKAAVRPLAEPSFSIEGCSAPVGTPAGVFELRARLLGRHNLANALSATACALALGLDLDVIAAGIASSPGAPGRLERVERADGSGPLVLVDYAHSPDAIEEVVRSLRPLVQGRLITLFGCGGDRDAGKRPLMARAAANADAVILTSDNPRSEDPERILDDAEEGLRGGATPYRRIPDRAAAIRAAIAGADRGDVVVLAGKGHESYQELATGRIEFDDRVEAAAALEAR